MTNALKAGSLLRTGWLETAESLLLWLGLFLLPWQWRTSVVTASLGGAFFEYGSIFLYASDIVVALLLIVWLAGGTKKIKLAPQGVLVPLGLLIVWMGLSIIWAQDREVVLTTFLHWALWGGWLLYLINRVKNLEQILWPLVWGLAFQAIWGVGQFVLNGSFSFLTNVDIFTEPNLNPAVSGVPVVIVDGLRQLRAHGMLPHANIFGGLMAAGVGAAVYLGCFNKNARWLIAPLAIAGILSFSRSGWLALVLVGIAILGMVIWTKRRVLVSSLVVLAVSVVVVGLWQAPAVMSRFDMTQSLEQRSWDERVEGLQVWQEVTGGVLLTGVGAGNYPVYLVRQVSDQPSWWYQPVHNAYLVMLGELGWVGLALFVSLILGMMTLQWKMLKQKSWCWLSVVPLAVWLVVGFFDHWPVVLHQGAMLLFVAVALIILSFNVSLKEINKEG
ncbi:MAG: O-antigen ligase family protein [Patescibacteria group bacterium]|nr:O-antigen ligase family protein [Patescibacteria group bacterium]